MSNLSSRKFNQNVSRARKAADLGPLVTADPGIRELLAMPGIGDVEFEAPRMDKGIFQAADLSQSDRSRRGLVRPRS